MRRRLTVALIILNVLLGFGILAQNAGTQIIPLGLFDCCKGGPEGYCCDGCCWFSHNCAIDSDCRQTVTAPTG